MFLFERGGFWLLLLVFVFLALPKGYAVDECGGSSTFTSRYSAHSSSPGTPYGTGTIVTTGSGQSLKLWRWTSSVTSTTAPTAAQNQGWEDVTTQYAALGVNCDSGDTLTSSSDILYNTDDLAIFYSRSVRSITHTGTGGEIHITSGSVARPYTGTSSLLADSTVVDAVSLSKPGTDALRLVLGSGASVSNTDPDTGSDAIMVSGGGNVFLDIAGSTSVNGGRAIFASAGGSGNVDINITGGTHTRSRNSAGSVVFAEIQSSGTGNINIDLTGGNFFMTVPRTDSSVIHVSGRGGADVLNISRNVVVCHGPNSGGCSGFTGFHPAIAFTKQATIGGSITLNNVGAIIGSFSVNAGSVGATINNLARGQILGGNFLAASGTTGSDTLTNANLWVLTGDSQFRGGTDSFTSSGDLIVYYSSGTLNLNDLETFRSSGTLRFAMRNFSTLPTVPFLNIGSAAVTVSGTLDISSLASVLHPPEASGIPTSGSITLITGTNIPSLSLANVRLPLTLGGYLSKSGNNLIFTFVRIPSICGAISARTLVSPGAAYRQVVCSSADTSLSTSTDLSFASPGIAAIYRGTRADGQGVINSITNTGAGGEIHLESGSVSPVNDRGDSVVYALRLESADTSPLRLVMNSGGYINNDDPTVGSSAIYVRGGGNVSLTVAGQTLTKNATGIVGRASGAGNVDIDITGGVHKSERSVVLGSVFASSALATVNTGTVDISITGSSTRLWSSSSYAVVSLSGRGGADRVAVGAGAMICAGTYNSPSNPRACTPRNGGIAINAAKGNYKAGSLTITNAGTIFGDIKANAGTLGTTITNQASGVIRGNFVSTLTSLVSGDDDVITNAGEWTVTGVSSFHAGTDSFTNTGTLIIHSSGTSAVRMNNLGNLLLVSGVLRFSIPNNRLSSITADELLYISQGAVTFGGIIEVVTRDGSVLPTSGSIRLMDGIAPINRQDPSAPILPLFTDSTSLGNVRVRDGRGTLSIVNNHLVLTFGPPCGASTSRQVVAPGHANTQIICDSADNLWVRSRVSRSDSRLAIIYRNGTNSVAQITNTGNGGEIHMESGSVSLPDDRRAGSRSAVQLGGITKTGPFRLVMSSGTSVENLDESQSSHAVSVSGSRNVSISVAGSTSAKATSSSAIYGHVLDGSLDVNVTGGTHKTTGGNNSEVIHGYLGIVGDASRKIDIEITGATTRLFASGGSTLRSVILLSGRTGADRVRIGTGVVVCRGNYTTRCIQSSGDAVIFGKNNAASGSATFSNAGSFYGDIRLRSGAFSGSLSNAGTGIIVGNLSATNRGNTVVTNSGTWTMTSNFNFGGATDADSFSNSGTFEVRYDNATLAMNNLETFTLISTGTLHFSLPSTTLPTAALLDIGGATPTLAGKINVTNRNGILPLEGSITLITGTKLSSTTSLDALSFTSGLAGTLAISNNNLVLTLIAATPNPTCGTATSYSSGHQNRPTRQVLCDFRDALQSTTNILRTDSRLVIFYRGTQADGSGSVNSISNTGVGGDIRIESGSVSRADDGTTAAVDAVVLSNTGTGYTALQTSSGTSVTNADTSSESDAIFVSGGGSLVVDLRGNTLAAGGHAISVQSLFKTSFFLHLHVLEGTHTSTGGSALRLFVSRADQTVTTKAIPLVVIGSFTTVGVTPPLTILSSSTGDTVSVDARDLGSVSVSVADRAVVCRGIYSAGSCSQSAGNALSINIASADSLPITGYVSISGSVYGDVRFAKSAVSVIGASGINFTNNASGNIVGNFIATNRRAVHVTNAGTWTMSGTNTFGVNSLQNTGSDTQRFTNSGTLVIRHSGSTIALNNLKAFTLESAGTLRFSLGTNSPLPTSALLSIGGAVPTLAGTLDIHIRDGSTVPSSGVIKLITGTGLSTSTDLSSLSVSGAYGTFSISNNELLLTLAVDPASFACGAAVARQVSLPGHANQQVVCDVSDTLLSTSNIVRREARIAIIYRGTQADGSGSVASIVNTGAGGEIHMESGFVSRGDDGDVASADAVELSNAGTDPLRFFMAAGTTVVNSDRSAGSDAVVVRGGGSVFLEIAGSTSAVRGRAIFAQAGSTGDINLGITDGSHLGTAGVLAAIATGGTGAIDVDISTSVIGASGVPIELSGRTGADTLDIGVGVVVCRGQYSSSGCAQSAGDAIFVGKNSADSGSVVVTTAGQLYGGISIGGGAFSVDVTNESDGVIVGGFNSESAGVTRLINRGTWTMLQSGAFGSGTSDSFVNSGRLVVRYAGSAIALTGLETFTQTAGGTLRIEIDPRGSDTSDTEHDGLPSGGALFDVERASGVLEGMLEVMILETLPSATLEALIAASEVRRVSVFNTGHSLDLRRLQLSSDLQRSADGAIFFRFAPEVAPGVSERPERRVPLQDAADDRDKAAAHTYDSVIQSSWFATRAFVNALAASECEVEDAFAEVTGIWSYLDGSCGWMNIGGRFHTHDRDTATSSEETNIVLSGGIQFSLGEALGYVWKVNTAASYELSVMEMGDQSNGQGHRTSAGVVLSSGLGRAPLNFAIGATMNRTVYEVDRTVQRIKSRGEPHIWSVGAHGGVEYVYARDIGRFGSFAFLPRVHVDAVMLFVDSFEESNSRDRIGEIEELLPSLTVSFEMRRSATLHVGALNSWLEVGLVGFAESPKLDYTVSGRHVEGTMEQFFLEASVGVNLVWSQRADISFFWDGLFGENTLSNTIAIKAKYAF